MYVDMAVRLATAGKNGKRRKAVQTVGPRGELRRSRAKGSYCQHRQRALRATTSLPLVTPSKNLHRRSRLQPCKVAVDEKKLVINCHVVFKSSSLTDGLLHLNVLHWHANNSLELHVATQVFGT